MDSCFDVEVVEEAGKVVGVEEVVAEAAVADAEVEEEGTEEDVKVSLLDNAAASRSSFAFAASLALLSFPLFNASTFC